jgi:hypothetical protein
VPEDVKEKAAFPLGEIVAKRRFTLYEKSGAPRQVIVEIGKPVPVSLQGELLADAGEDDHFRCPLSITGLGLDSRVFPPSGEDSLMALQHAIVLGGQVIDEAVRRLNLINPLHEAWERHRPGKKHFDAAGYPDWLYRYDSRPDTDYGLWKDR